MSSRRRSRIGGRPLDREIGRSVEEGPAVAVGVEDAVAGLGGGSRLLRLLLLCGLHHFYSERSRGAGVEEQCWRLEGRESSPRQRRQTGARRIDKSVLQLQIRWRSIERRTGRCQGDRCRSRWFLSNTAATGYGEEEEHSAGRWHSSMGPIAEEVEETFFSLYREKRTRKEHAGKKYYRWTPMAGKLWGGNDCCGWGDRQWRLRQKRGCGRGKKMRAAAGAKQKAQLVATWVAAVTEATTRWVRLQAAGRDEFAIGDDDVAEVVAALKMSWPEIWRHCWPSIVRNVSFSTCAASTDARLERMVARVVGPQRATTDRGEESAPMIESWSGAVDSVAEASVISKRLSFDSKKK
ncbi:hypothetical protein B296_00044017 [Ensete ventricosum]|uniref:Uncharacterized protein n=1 Tax=Ensete ventricosum TaxID=4639 RepID=A0A426ZCJ3_ENSVE|nr:hypothetical protein B296_00044017 [Ensete ventricosum]